jgi:hypothetical protein
MASGTNHETNVAVVGEGDASNDVGCRGYIDSVLDISPEYAPSRSLGERITAAVGEEGGHDGRLVRVAASINDLVR